MTNNTDLSTFLGAAVDRTVMNFIDRVSKKFKLSSKDLVAMWDSTPCTSEDAVTQTKRKMAFCNKRVNRK